MLLHIYIKSFNCEDYILYVSEDLIPTLPVFRHIPVYLLHHSKEHVNWFEDIIAELKRFANA